MTARRALALSASAAVLGSAAGATPIASPIPDRPATQDFVHLIEAEGEGTEAEGEAAASAESEGESGALAEGESEGSQKADGEGEGSHESEGEAMQSAEGEGESSAEGEGEGGEAGLTAEGEAEGGGGGTAPAVAQSRDLLTIGGLLNAAAALRDAGDAGAEDLIEEAAEDAEHKLKAPLADELYETIESLEGAQDTAGFASVQKRVAVALAEGDAVDRLEAAPTALRAAAEDYAEAVKEGAVEDRTEYLEAFGIYQAVRADIEALAASDDAEAAEVAAEMLTQLDIAGTAFDGTSGANISTPDASLLYGAAARMELAALRLR